MTINFPPRPNENSDPWYAARETYDRGLENAINSLENSKMEGTRGVLPNGTDVDDLYSASDVGTWRVVDTYTYQNLPQELGNPALFHVAESARSVFQFHIGVGFFCWRFRSANVWGAWYDVVSHTSLDGVVSTLEDSKMEVTRGALPDGTDVNDLHSTSDVGTWRAVDTRTYRNLPEVPVNPSILYVAESARSVFQMYIGNGFFWWRFRSANVWDRWRKVASQDSIDGVASTLEDTIQSLESKMDISKGALPDGTDVDDLYSTSDAGAWRAVNTLTYQNLPEDPGNPAILYVSESARSVFQLYIGVRFFWWRFRSANVWDAWRKVATQESLDGAVATLEDSIQSLDGVASTLEDSIQSLEDSKMDATRGVLPDGTDVDDLYSTSAVGTWRVVDTYTYQNLPEELGNPAILYVAESSRSVFQLHIGVKFFWWRFRSANVWDAWRKIATQESVDTKLADHEDRLTALEGLIGT